MGSRKDYQASYIVDALETIHHVDEENSLKRLKEVFEIQTQLQVVGNGRMNHICKSELIEFTSRHYPELAFKLLSHEENNIARDEALSIILSPQIKKAKKEELDFFFAVVRTLPKWESSGTGKGHFLQLCMDLLNRACSLKAEDFLQKILKAIKHNILIDLEKPKELKDFVKVLQENELSPSAFGLQMTNKSESNQKINGNNSSKAKFILNYTKPDTNELIKMLNSDYEKLNRTLIGLLVIRIKNKRSIGLRNEYYTLKENFITFYDVLPSELKQSVNSYKLIREYLIFRDGIVQLPTNTSVSKKQISKLLNSLIKRVDAILLDERLSTYIGKELDSTKIVEDVEQVINESREYIISTLLSDEEINTLISNTSILNIDNVISFLEDWTTGFNYSKGMLTAANRLLPINQDRAKIILEEISEKRYENLLFSNQYSKDKLGFDVVETFIKSERESGLKFLLKSFLSQKGSYHYEIISSIAKLLKYSCYFQGQKVEESYYKANLTYNKALCKGLPKKKTSYEFIESHITGKSLPLVIIDYCVQLFDFPVIKIRQATLWAIFDLFQEDSNRLKDFFKLNLKSFSNNQIEHILIVLKALSLKGPKIVHPYKKELLNLLSLKHFNIQEGPKDILLKLDEMTNGFLTAREKSVVNKINTPTGLLIPKALKTLERGRNYIHSKVQANLMYYINLYDSDENEIQDELYRYLKYQKGYGDFTAEQDAIVHRNYNINTNFDTIEIHSPYYEEVQNGINKIVYQKVIGGYLNSNAISMIKPKLRLFDPSLLTQNSITRPDYINWLPKLSEKGFIDFCKIDSFLKSFASREKNYITLFESGSQRSIDGQRESKFSTYFEVYAFIKDACLPLEKEFEYIPLAQHENAYDFELPNSDLKSNSFPLKGIKPIIEKSVNQFRGEKQVSSAMLLKEFMDELGLLKQTLLDTIQNSKKGKLQAFRWQNAYTSGYRRYKPSSEGFTLKINKELLINYLLENEKELCFNFRIKRSDTRYRSEEHMDWHNFEKNIIAPI